MRIWHKNLIPVLPGKQLVAQWRELRAIIGSIDKGKTVSPLVKEVLDYPIIHFTIYARMISDEMTKRGYKISTESAGEFIRLCNTNMHKFNNSQKLMLIRNDEDVYKNWHNGRYLRQCYYNLQEKYDCGMISEEEFIKIIPICCKYL